MSVVLVKMLAPLFTFQTSHQTLLLIPEYWQNALNMCIAIQNFNLTL